MKKFTAPGGLIVYEATADDTRKLGGGGICDFCNKYSEKGYLIPVMNRYHCPACYEKYTKNSKAYPEDRRIEQKGERYFDSVFGIKEGLKW